MKKNLTKMILIALVAILPLSIFAQKKQSVPVEKYFYISAEGGLSINHTDLANYGGVAFIQNNKFTIDDYLLKNFDGKIGLGYQLGKVIGINGKFGIGTLGGEKHGQKLIVNEATTAANKAFEDAKFEDTKLLEGNLNLTFNFFNLFFGYNPRRVFNFNPHIGVGGLGYKAGAVKSTVGADAPNLKAMTTRDWALTVPVGAELTFNLARMLDFYIDYTFTWAGSDGLDQVQKEVDDIQVINDMYSSLNAGLRLKFNKKPCNIEEMANRSNEITMRTEPDPLEEKDGKVCFDVIFNIPGGYFEKDAVMNITPTFAYNGGQVALDPVTFVGENVKDPNADFKVNYKKGGEFTKHYCTDFVPEMESGKLVGTPMFYVYDGTIYPTQDEIANNVNFAQGGEMTIADGVKYEKPVVIVENTPVDTVETIEPAVVEPDFIFYFDYNSSNLKSNTKLNKEAVKAMASKLVEGNAINGFEIQGWASPEGELQLNQDLANDRADAAAKAIKNQLKKVKLNEKNFTFTPNGNGPDWDKFIELVENSNIKDKDQIVRVINNAGSQAKKEQEIKNMINVYPELEKDILPLIRRAEVYIK